MAASVLDIIDGSDLIIAETIMTKIRIALVTGVTGTNAEREFDALSVAGVPSLGDSLGSGGTLGNCIVIRKSVRPRAGQPNTLEVRCFYSTETTALSDISDSDTPTFESSGVVTQEQTNADIDGNLISVSYTAGGVTRTRGAFINVFRPSLTETMRRIETGIEPHDLQNEFMNKTNSVAWLGGEIGEWLCTMVHARALDAGDRWEVTYTFIKRVGGWDPVAVFIDEETGQPPADLVDGTGVVTVTSYDQVNFFILDLI